MTGCWEYEGPKEFKPWSDYWDRKFTVNVPERGTFNAYATDVDSDFYVICVHGAGHSALSFSLLAKALKGQVPVCAFDLKCHGDTPGNITEDMKIDSLVADVKGFCETVLPEGKRLILIGHSVGGSVAARVALTLHMSSLVVVDTIEESSLENLENMKEMLMERPDSFVDEADAIYYIANSGEMTNGESAAASASGRLNRNSDGSLTWKTDLLMCEGDWPGWFEGYCDVFLESQPYKILFVPEITRLDSKFSVGHLNGMFQLNVLLDTNHCMHEDKPVEFAAVIIKMMQRLRQTHDWD